MKLYHRFKLRTDRSLKNGEYPIIMVITKYGKRQFISLNITSSIKFWDEEQQRLVVQKGLRITQLKEDNEQRIKKNALLERYNQRALDIIYDFEREHIDWTLKQFKDKFFNRVTQGKIKPFIEKHIQTLLDTNHIGTAKNYTKTLRIWELYDNKLSERLFVELDYNYVIDLNNWLQRRNCCGNTRFGYLKSIKSIFLKAIRDGVATKTNFPFTSSGFNVSELKEETTKRYLPSGYLQQLKERKSEVPSNEFARLLFLFSYYTYGMSFIDMANLKHANVIHMEKGEYIVYYRQKTRNRKNAKPISIRMTAELETLIAEISQHKEPLDDFLLPLITRQKDSALELYQHIEGQRARYNGNLKKLAKEFGFEFNITSYVSRHTMAMQLQENEIPESVISQVMGHKKLETTKVYLDSLKTDVIDKAAEVL